VLIAADSQVLGSFFDATLLVVETRTARREMALRAMELLRRADAKPVGVAINKARQREQGYYYYYYYHYNYYKYNSGYGYGAQKKKPESKES
jgi:Mrp family chromosome partitioning ATPase